LRQHRSFADQVDRTLRDLKEDPFQPHLHTHPLHGPLAGLHAVNITRDYRITMAIHITEREVELLDIGTHDDVYR
jgi:mRNA-degrading endonuclease YafQ of YafQ-DinJ toxin-antitoxin module